MLADGVGNMNLSCGIWSGGEAGKSRHQSRRINYLPLIFVAT